MATFPAQTDRQRRHRKATSEAMQRMVSSCPHCHRRGIFRKHWLGDAQCLLWVCHFCRGEWTAERSVTGAPPMSDAPTPETAEPTETTPPPFAYSELLEALHLLADTCGAILPTEQLLRPRMQRAMDHALAVLHRHGRI